MMRYDSVCMNDQCIREKNAFFSCIEQNCHLPNNHNVKSIHPLSFVSLFPKVDAQLNHDVDGNTRIHEDLIKIRDEAYHTVINAIKELFYETLMPKFQEQTALCKNLDMKIMMEKMSGGSYTLLRFLKQFQQQNEEKNFRSYFVKMVNAMNYEIQNFITNIKNSLLNMCLNLKSFASIEKPFQSEGILISLASEEYIPQKNVEFQESEVKLQPQIKQEYISRIFSNDWSNLDNALQIEEDDDESQSLQSMKQGSHNHIEKIKLIKKQQKDKKKMKKRRKKYKIQDQIELIKNRTEIVVKQARNPNRTLQYLFHSYTEVKAIHILHHKFAQKIIIKNILQNFPKIEKITLNCSHQIQSQFFEEIDRNILSRLRVEFKWDMNMFFNEYFAYRYFPRRILRSRQRGKKINMEQMTKYLPNNNSMWVCDNESLLKLNDLSINFNSITSLHYCPIGTYEKFYFSPKFQKIKVLNIKNINFYESIWLFDQFVDINEGIKVITISDCIFSFITLSKFLIKMKKLQYLQKLSITTSQKKKITEINCEDIFNLVNLTHLNIDGYKFKNSTIKDFGKMTKLKHLGLYECQIHPQFLNNISPKCINALQYLNLGKTYVNNSSVLFLKQMYQLKYLNMDATKLKGETLVEIIRCMAKQSDEINPLKYLSFQKYEDKSEPIVAKENLQQIAKYLPNLSYLNIAYNENLTTYDFSDFKNLKWLAVDRDQAEKLQLIISPEIVCYKVSNNDRIN